MVMNGKEARIWKDKAMTSLKLVYPHTPLEKEEKHDKI
jgi:hypothetical protein